jgi:DNA primase large subunit
MGKLLYMGLSYNFLAMTPKALSTKAKIDNWDYIKLEIFTIKETLERMKDKLRKGRKYL